MLTPVLFVTSVKLDVTIPRPFVLKESSTKVTTERHLIAVSLLKSKQG